MGKKRGALLGFGAVAEKAHLPAFASSAGFELVAVAESSPARREAAEAALPNARVYESPEALYHAETALDFVDVATPPFLHAAQVLAALDKGLHVLCEKPLALTTDDFAKIKAAAQVTGKTVFTVHNWACAPQWRELFKRLPEIGAVKHASLCVLRTQPSVSAVPGDWRRDAALSGGGILVDHGWHNLYLLRRLVGAAPRKLWASLEPLDGAESTAKLSFEFPTATADLYMTWGAASRENSALVVGAQGSLHLLDGALQIRRGETSKTVAFEEKLSQGSAHPAWMAELLPEFLAELEDPAARGRNLDEAGFCLQTIQRAYQSARVGRNPLRESFQAARAR